MDFSPWDLSDSFRLHEAACLMAGVLPLSKRVPNREELPAQAIPYYVKLGKAYFVGAYEFDRPEDERFQRETLLTGDSTDESGKPDIPLSTDELTGELVSRAELQRWIAATRTKSAYSFAPVAEPDTVAGKKWTPERLAELRAYRAAHTMVETAKHFGISQARIRELDPREKPMPKGYSAFTHRPK